MILKIKNFPKVFKIQIPKDVFIMMLLSAIDTGKKECLGYLFGKLPTKRYPLYLVSNIHHQGLSKFRKKYTETEPTLRSWKRLVGAIECLDSRFLWLGSFHSHPGWGKLKGAENLSEWDQKDSISTDLPIDIIISINNQRRLIPWGYVKNGTVRGTFGGYYFRVAAWFTEVSEDKSFKSTPMQISCGGAIGYLNRLQKMS